MSEDYFDNQHSHFFHFACQGILAQVQAATLGT